MDDLNIKFIARVCVKNWLKVYLKYASENHFLS